MNENELKKTAGRTKAEQAAPEAEPAEQAAPEAEPAEQETGTVIYIGPDILGAKQYTTFNGGLPDTLKEKMAKYPVFCELVIPVGKLAKACAELARDGSALNTFYRKACEK